MSTGWGKGSTRRWRQLRRAVLARDRDLARRTGESWCRVRVPGVCIGEGVPMHVHHLDGVKGGHRPDRLVTSCAPCNLHIGDPTRAGRADPPNAPITNW